jgi:hypothetical protein
MNPLGAQAELEGEAWARRLFAARETTLQMAWPGRAEDAQLIASTLSSDPTQQEFLARIIQARARIVWHTLSQAEST